VDEGGETEMQIPSSENCIEGKDTSFAGKLKFHCPSIFNSLSLWERDFLSIFNSSLGICVFSIPGFMDVDFPSDKAILEAMIMDLRPPPQLKNLQVGY
jgi:hypothetical protein